MKLIIAAIAGILMVIVGVIVIDTRPEAAILAFAAAAFSFVGAAWRPKSSQKNPPKKDPQPGAGA